MKYKFITISLLLGCVVHSFSQDPVITDGDKYKSILENDKVRVLEYKDKPGDKTSRHHHPDFVLYALEPFKRKLTFGNGKQVEREFKKGDVISYIPIPSGALFGLSPYIPQAVGPKSRTIFRRRSVMFVTNSRTGASNPFS